MILLVTEVRLTSLSLTNLLTRSSQGFLCILFKNQNFASPFPVGGNFTEMPQLLIYDGEWLSYFICQFPKNLNSP